jgi:DNA-binding FadR family transcriptional regulator
MVDIGRQTNPQRPVSSAARGSPRAAVAVAKALLDYIDEQGLAAGDSLPIEREMLEWLGVARSTLREALRLLEAQGVITIRAGRGGGPAVGEVGPDDHVSSTTMLLQAMKVRFGSVIDARVSIEPEIAAGAALARSQAQVDDLAAAVADMYAAQSDSLEFQPAYNRFHKTVGEATHNPVLLMTGATFRRIWETLHPEIAVGAAEAGATARAHRSLFEAIRDRDPGAARTASRRHLELYRAWVAEHRPEWLERRVEWIVDPRDESTPGRARGPGTSRPV